MIRIPTRLRSARPRSLIDGCVAALAALAMLGAPACSSGDRMSPSSSSPANVPPNAPVATKAQLWDDQPTTAAARKNLAALTVTPADTKAGYSRDAWEGWNDENSGCDTGKHVLRVQATVHETIPGKGCRPLCHAAACWLSPYDGVRLDHAEELEIDHIVPFKEAARSGAQNWDQAQRRMFANDTANLVAVTKGTIKSKDDRDPAAWKPAKKGSWCTYARAYTTIKKHYRLTVDAPERDALDTMLDGCK